MKNFSAGFVVGLMLALALTWFVLLPVTRESYREVGRNNGMILTRDQIADQVAEELGDDLDREESRKIFFGAKHRSVVVVERNGVKTLRVID